MTTKRYPPAVGEPPAIQFVAVDRLQTDPSYQRPIDNKVSRNLIEKIASGWDWRLCVPLLVAQRPEGLFVIDGQHRTEAARIRGDIPHLPCSVVAFASCADEAVTFATANRQRKVMTKLDLFRASVAAGDIEAVIINQLVTDAGLAIAMEQSPLALKPGQLAFTTALFNALRRQGRSVLSAALTTIGEVFGRQLLSNGSTIFNALVYLFANPPADFDCDELHEVLGTMSAEEWVSHPIVDSYAGSGTGKGYRMRQAIEHELALYRREQADVC